MTEEARELLREQDFKPPRLRPFMPERDEDEADYSWSDELHRFYITGENGDPDVAAPLSPAGLAPLAELDSAWRDYPLVLLEDGGVAGLTTVIDRALDAVEKTGGQTVILREHRARISRAAAGIIEQRGGPSPFREVVNEACTRMANEIDLSDAGLDELDHEIDHMLQQLPHSGSIIGLGSSTLLRLYEAAVRDERGPHEEVHKKIKKLVAGLEELLLVDDVHSPEGASPQAITASIGEGVADMFDAEELSRNLPSHPGSKRMDPARRERIEQTKATMEAYLRRAAGEPPFILLHHGQIDEAELAGAKMVESEDGLEAAVGLFDMLASQIAELYRAMRVARLERDGEYDPERHDRLLARFDWRSFTEEEISLLPPVVVFETGERLLGGMAASFSALLRSGRPIQVVVEESISEEISAGLHSGFGYIAVAHRESFVMQSTLAYPGHLFSGLRRMMTTARPAVSLVSAPVWDAEAPPWLQLAAANFGRGTPCFRYDADAGLTLAESFDLSENPQPQSMWPLQQYRYSDESEQVLHRDEAITPAHAMALDPAHRKHFRVIPSRAWNDDQVEIAVYLQLSQEARSHRVPFIWVVSEEGELGRAVTTRDVVFACRDRMRAWRILQELGGADNEYARRAAQAARSEALAEAEQAREEMEQAHAEEIEETRAKAAGEAMERLVSVLMSDDALLAAAPATAPPLPSATEPAEEAAEDAEPAVAEEEAEEAVSFNEPYIDSVLCTTCNECTNLNNRMFRYNDNKQAFIADPKAGTFAELVQAAQKCPARCIHPGVPREGDDTATEEMIAKAAPFN
jgi:ferredoxin